MVNSMMCSSVPTSRSIFQGFRNKINVVQGRKGMETSEASQIKIKICITSGKII